MMLSKEKKGNRIRQSISLFVSLLISALLFSSHVSALAIQDLPLNDGNRTLTRISIKRTYPLNDSELQKLSQPDRQLLDKDDYGVLAFRSAYTTDANAKRMIIMLHGFGRDAWQYQDTANDALYEAIGLTDSPDQNDIKKLKLDETLIVSPQFINEEDMELYYQTNDLQFDDVANLTTYDSPSIETTLVWQNTSWAEGADSILPTNITSPPDQEGNSRLIKAPSMSSFEVMDAMVDQATNKTRYPKLETIIVAGHSLGAQFVQRYALIGAIPSKQIPVHFFIANPGSYVYLTDKRPRSTKNCTTTYNEWKFGLGVFGIRYLYNMVVTSLDTLNDITDVRVRYLRDRQVHYLYGLNDTGNNGDRRCQAMSQGRNHLERGRNYLKHINQTSLALHLEHSHTVDFVPGIAHDARGMFYSPAGIRRLFLSNIDGTEIARGVGIADPDSNLYPYRFTQPTNSANSILHGQSLPPSILAITLTSLSILCIFAS